MKVGFIGFGKSANRYHAPFLDTLEDVEVVGYYSQGNDFEMVYPKYKDLKRFETIEEFLDSNIELVIISTPPIVHGKYAKLAIEHNKHVIVEKPFCNTLKEAHELYELAHKFNVKITPYQNRRFDSDFLDIKLALEENDLGQIIEIESNHTQYRTDGADKKGDKYDGFVYGHAVHFVDQIVSLYGEPDDVIYDTTNQKNYYLNDNKIPAEELCEDYYNIILIYGNMRVRVRFSQIIVLDPPRWIINTTNSCIQKYMIDQQERDLKKGIFLDNPSFGEDPKEAICKIYYKDGSNKDIVSPKKHYTEFYKQFINYINTGENPPVKENEVYIVLNILETIVNKQKYQKLS